MMSGLEQVMEYGVCPHVWGVCEECQTKVDAYLDGRNAEEIAAAKAGVR